MFLVFLKNQRCIATSDLCMRFRIALGFKRACIFVILNNVNTLKTQHNAINACVNRMCQRALIRNAKLVCHKRTQVRMLEQSGTNQIQIIHSFKQSGTNQIKRIHSFSSLYRYLCHKNQLKS